MVSYAIIAPTEVFVDAWCQQDKHAQDFRFYWRCRGVDIHRNGQVFNLRGIQQVGKDYERMAREYGR